MSSDNKLTLEPWMEDAIDEAEADLETEGVDLSWSTEAEKLRVVKAISLRLYGSGVTFDHIKLSYDIAEVTPPTS